MTRRKEPRPLTQILAPKCYPTLTSRADFVATPLKYERYVLTRAVPQRAGSMDAYQLPSIEFGQRKDV